MLPLPSQKTITAFGFILTLLVIVSVSLQIEKLVRERRLLKKSEKENEYERYEQL